MARILVVEDEPGMRQLYASVLSQLGHQVVVAATGPEGLDAAWREGPDLILLDLLLPGMSGDQVAHRLREQGILPATPLIITTALPDAEAYAAARACGAHAVLVKPFGIAALVEVVRAALDASGDARRGV